MDSRQRGGPAARKTLCPTLLLAAVNGNGFRIALPAIAVATVTLTT